MVGLRLIFGLPSTNRSNLAAGQKPRKHLTVSKTNRIIRIQKTWDAHLPIDYLSFPSWASPVATHGGHGGGHGSLPGDTFRSQSAENISGAHLSEAVTHHDHQSLRGVMVSCFSLGSKILMLGSSREGLTISCKMCL